MNTARGWTCLTSPSAITSSMRFCSCRLLSKSLFGRNTGQRCSGSGYLCVVGMSFVNYLWREPFKNKCYNLKIAGSQGSESWFFLSSVMMASFLDLLVSILLGTRKSSHYEATASYTKFVGCYCFSHGLCSPPSLQRHSFRSLGIEQSGAWSWPKVCEDMESR